MEIRFLKAFEGDCIYVRHIGEETVINIVIDSGTENCYTEKDKRGKLKCNTFYTLIEELRCRGEKIDLLILTHVDNDHIGGLINWFSSDESASELVKRVWFNSGLLIKEFFNDNENYDNSLKFSTTLDTGIPEGVKFEDVISKNKIWERKLIKSGDIIVLGNLEFNILSPNKKSLRRLLKKWEKEAPDSLDTAQTNDYNLSLADLVKDDSFIQPDGAVHNGSSIAFILKEKHENESVNYVFLGDSHPKVIIEGLKKFGYNIDNPLQAEFVKLSHHGSKFNNSEEMLSIIATSKYVISTDGKRNGHPHKKLLASIINNSENCELHFNYSDLPAKIFLEEDFNFKTFTITSTDDE